MPGAVGHRVEMCPFRSTPRTRRPGGGVPGWGESGHRNPRNAGDHLRDSAAETLGVWPPVTAAGCRWIDGGSRATAPSSRPRPLPHRGHRDAVGRTGPAPRRPATSGRTRRRGGRHPAAVPGPYGPPRQGAQHDRGRPRARCCPRRPRPGDGPPGQGGRHLARPATDRRGGSSLSTGGRGDRRHGCPCGQVRPADSHSEPALPDRHRRAIRGGGHAGPSPAAGRRRTQR